MRRNKTGDRGRAGGQGAVRFRVAEHSLFRDRSIWYDAAMTRDRVKEILDRVIIVNQVREDEGLVSVDAVFRGAQDREGTP